MAPVGVILVVGLAAALSAGTAAYVMTSQEPEQPISAGFLVNNGPDRMRVQMTSGDPLPADGTDLVLETAEHQNTIPLSGFTGEIGPSWNTGEAICLVGDGSFCSYLDGEDALESFRVTSGDQVLYEWEGTPEAADETGATGPILLSSSSGSGGSGGSGGSSSPDLTATIVGPSPSNPVAGESTTFDVRVENTGDAATGSATQLAVRVDGTVLSTHAVADLAAGENVTVTSDAWTAESGSHAVTATSDDGTSVSEADETNNDDTLALSVGSEDPGHAFEDANNDAIYTAGTDVPISAEAIQTGTYTVSTPGYGLVVPASVDPISADAIDLEAADGGHLILATDVTSESGSIELGSGAALNASDVDLTSSTTLQLTAGDDVDVSGSTLSADATVSEPKGNKVHICHYPPGNTGNVRTMTVSENAVDTHEDHHGDYHGACVEDDGILIELDQASRTVHADGVTVDDPDDTAIVRPGDAAIEGTEASGTVEGFDPDPIGEE